MIGKWHLGWDWPKDGKTIDFTKPVVNGPNINGFDSYYGHCGSLDMPPYVWVDTGKVTAVPDREEGVTKQEDRYGWYRKGPIGSNFHIPEVLPHLFDKSIAHVKERAEAAHAGKPFFLYLPLPAPHTPIVPVPPFKDASGLNPYADFVMQVDHLMGRLLDAVKKAGLDDNTLVIFTSDNGCSPEANFPLLAEHGHAPSGRFRGHKADIYEGGHRVPLLARWPGTIPAGRTTNTLTCLTDIYPTLAEITRQPRAKEGGEDGFSLLPVFLGKGKSARDSLISHSVGGSFAIRQGDWKLCLCRGSGGWSAPKENDAKKQGLPPLQLYDLKDDPAETTNVAADHPAEVSRLLQVLQSQVAAGRCTPGEPLANDRDVTFLPAGVSLPGD
jgi:arylsulfatase A